MKINTKNSLNKREKLQNIIKKHKILQDFCSHCKLMKLFHIKRSSKNTKKNAKKMIKKCKE